MRQGTEQQRIEQDLIPAIIITNAAAPIRILIPRNELICSTIKLYNYIFFSFRSDIIATAETK